MVQLRFALIMVPPLLVGLYTFNYARWAWQRQLRRGAIGLFLLAAAAVGVPGFVIWWTS